jgi:hypothetical protein
MNTIFIEVLKVEQFVDFAPAEEDSHGKDDDDKKKANKKVPYSDKFLKRMHVTFVFNDFDLVEHFVLLVFLLELLLLKLLGLAKRLTGGC